MRKIGMRCVLIAMFLVGCVRVFAGDWESHVVYGATTDFDALAKQHPFKLPSSVVSPSELREFRFTHHQKVSADAVVPHEVIIEDGDDDSLLKVPVVTPSQEMAEDLNKFVVSNKEDEESEAVRTPSPVKRAWIRTLLGALEEEMEKNPVQLRDLLTSKPELFSCLKELLNEERVASPKKRRSFHEDGRQRSLSGGSIALEQVKTEA